MPRDPKVLEPVAALTVRPIGVVRSPFKVHAGTPRQPGVAPVADGEIELRPGLQNLLKDLKTFSHVWVLFWCNYSRGWNAQVVPPRDTKKRGVLATRAPHRPNPIGLSVVRLLDVRGRTLRVRGLDMLDGTPVLDLKPYVPYADCIPDATNGWLAELPVEKGRPDHRAWKKKTALLLATCALFASTACREKAAVGAGRSGAATSNPAPASDGEPSVLDASVAAPAAGDAQAAAPFLQQAAALQQAQRLGDAKEAFERALAADPANVGALLGLGFLLLEPEPYNAGAALLSFRRARALAPEQLAAIAGEGITRAALGDAPRAEPLLRRALAELPATARGLRALAAGALADLQATSGRDDAALQEALQLYEQADAPELSDLLRAGARVRAAELLQRLARNDVAEAKVRAALALDPENVRGHHLLATLLARRGAAAEAKSEARIHELFRQLRDHTSPRFMQDVERRVLLWREIVQLYPAYRRAPYELVREQLEGARFGDAQRELATLAQRDGTTAEILFLTARAKAGAGDLAGAKAAADAMRRADPKVPAAVLRAVLEDWRRGDPSIDAATFERTAREWLGGS